MGATSPNLRRQSPSYSLATNAPYYMRSLGNLYTKCQPVFVRVPCISCLCVGLGSFVLVSSNPWSGPHGAPGRASRVVPGPGYYIFCGTAGVELDSRRIGHAIRQSVSNDPHSTILYLRYLTVRIHVGENRHGNLGTYSGDGEGDNPLLEQYIT